MTHDHHHQHHHHELSELRAQPVVLDLGDGVGALIVHTGPELLGAEIDLSPAGDDGRRRHKQVLRRLVGHRETACLVYDDLPEGGYTVWLPGEPVRNVQVRGGAVAELYAYRATV
jgi:hypothetical protein